ncbi:MAG: Uma2 family endonuclease [Planctomycetota bacterium]
MPAVLENTTSLVIKDVSWAFYVQTRDEMSDSIQVTFDQGRLEIMSPVSYRHDDDLSLLTLLLEQFLIARSIGFRKVGGLTLASPLAERAAEPDGSYYIHNDPPPGGTRNIDLAIHEAPDLIIEVDLSSHSVSKEPVYAAFGVTELWRWEEDRLTVRRLNEQRTGYDDATESTLLTGLPINQLVEHVVTGRDRPDNNDTLASWKQVVESSR